LTKKLLVEAEGIKKEYSQSLFFCPMDYPNRMFTDKISLHLPKKIVPGSVYAELSVVGKLNLFCVTSSVSETKYSYL